MMTFNIDMQLFLLLTVCTCVPLAATADSQTRLLEKLLQLVQHKRAGSWDSYIDNIIAYSSGACDKAAIIGLDGSKWTTDIHPNALKITASEALTIGTAMENRDFTTFEVNGVIIEGIKYGLFRVDTEDDSVKVTAKEKKKPMRAIIMQRTKTAVVIGRTKGGDNLPVYLIRNTDKGVANVAEYLDVAGM